MPRRNRTAITEAIRRKLVRIGPPYLPMPHVVADWAKKKVECKEWTEYRERCERHYETHPDYVTGFHRPRIQTAEQVWALMSSHSDLNLTKLLPKYTRYKWLTGSERLELEATAKRALVIVLDWMITAGKHGMITFNTIFDALAARYSDHHRGTPATTVRDMSKDRAKRCRRDLLLNGVSVKGLWRVATGSWSRKDGGNPFYYVDRLPTVGYRVIRREGSQGPMKFLDIVDKDSEYSLARPPAGLRLLFDEKGTGNEWRPPERIPKREVCADVIYNEIKIGERSESILQAQEEARLVFDIAAFREDYKKVKADMLSLRQRLETEYRLDLSKSIVERKLRQRSKLNKIWSLRDEELFCRSLEKGLEIGWEAVDHDLQAACRRELKENEGKWAGHIRRYQKWCKDRGRPLREVSCEDLIMASSVTKDWRDKARELLVRYDRARIHLGAYGEVNEQLTSEKWSELQYVDIRARFYKSKNRRYQPTHFWPTFVTSKNTLPEKRQGLSESEYESYRRRWFKARDTEGKICNLVGVDISSSQTQIIAMLIGSDALLGLAASNEKSLKDHLAEWAWTRHQDPRASFKLRQGRNPYSGADDKRLRELVKNLWMRVCYGSPIYQVVRDQWDDPVTYGPGWAKQRCAEELLDEQPGYQDMRQFLEACRQVVRLAYKGSRHDGSRLMDPFDNAPVRWNPVERVEYELGIEGQKLALSLPGRKKPDGRLVMYRLSKQGDYPVDKRGLIQMFPPCFVHMLDAYFSSLVMEKLAQRGIRDFVGIHDCWLVPKTVLIDARIQGGREVLQQVIDEAATEWYRGLGPVYSKLEESLGADETHLQFVRGMKRRWEECMWDQKYPKFAHRSV